MAAGLVYYYVRKTGVGGEELKGAVERLELHLKYLEGELEKHEWYVSLRIRGPNSWNSDEYYKAAMV